MRIQKGDKIKVIAGANKGTIAEVLHVSTKKGLVWVEGVNMRTKHIKPDQSNTDGRIDTYEAPIDISNVAFYDEKKKTVSKIGYKIEGENKVRIVKKTGLEVGKSAKPSLKSIIKPTKKVAADKKKVEAAKPAKTAATKPAAVKTTGAAKKAPAAKGGAK